MLDGIADLGSFFGVFPHYVLQEKQVVLGNLVRANKKAWARSTSSDIR